MRRAVGILATAVVGVFAATVVHAQSRSTETEHDTYSESHSTTAEGGGFVGQHTMTGTVTDIDKDEGKVTIETEGHTLDLHFPKTAIRSFTKGDRVTVQLAIKEAGSNAGTSGTGRTQQPSPGADSGSGGSRY